MREEVKQKHWSESSVFPVFRLTAPRHNQEFIVLEGDTEDTLLFGPGRAPNSFLPGDLGTVVIHAYRHFSFLQKIVLNDQIILNDQLGTEYQYCVLDVSIIDLNKQQIEIAEVDELKLVTPWPFDGATKDNSLRYIVTARKYETYQD